MILSINYMPVFAHETDSVAYEKWIQNMEVSAQRFLYQVRSDKIVYNVSVDSSLVGKTTFDALRKTPLLMVTYNGEVFSVGNWSVEYLVNGLNEPLMSGNIQAATESLDAKYIKRIEVSIERNADGSEKLLVNFVTKGRLLGCRGTLHTRLADDSWRNEATIFLKRGRWGMSIWYLNLWEWGHVSTQESEEWRYNEPLRFHVSHKQRNIGYQADLNSLETNLTYEVSPLKFFTLHGRAIYKVNPHYGSSTNVLAESDASNRIYKYTAVNNSNIKDTEYEVSAYYEWLFGENAENGKFIAEYEFYRRPKENKTKQRYENLSCSLPEYWEEFYNMNECKQEFENWHTLEVTFRHKIKKHEIWAEIYSQYRYEGDELWSSKNYDYAVESHAATDWSKYIHKQAENILNVGYKYSSGKIQTMAGGSYFYLYDFSKTLEIQDAFSFSQSYCTPYAGVSFLPTSRSVLRLSYGMNKRVPDIQALNPYVHTNIPGRISYGNPNLKAETAQSLSLSYNFHIGKVNLYTASIHTFSKDIILEHHFLKDGVLHITKSNIGRRYESQWTVNASSRFTRTTFGRLDARLYFTNYAETKLYRWNKGYTLTIKGLIEKELLKNFDFSMSGEYTSPWIYMQGKSGHNFNYQLRIDKSFPKQRVTIGIEANSFIPLHYKEKKDVITEDYYSITQNHMFHASFLFSFRWRFGKLKTEERNKEGGIEHNNIKNRYDK